LQEVMKITGFGIDRRPTHPVHTHTSRCLFPLPTLVKN
jgi:hypothetical protein